VRAVLFIFVAVGLQNIAVRKQEQHELNGDLLGKDLGIFDGHLHVRMAEISAAEALLNTPSLAIAYPSGIGWPSRCRGIATPAPARMVGAIS
jgi:hypothetical protein